MNDGYVYVFYFNTLKGSVKLTYELNISKLTEQNIGYVRSLAYRVKAK